MRRILVCAMIAGMAFPLAAQEENERDRKKNAAALYSEGLRAETEKPINLALAISAFMIRTRAEIDSTREFLDHI